MKQTQASLYQEHETLPLFTQPQEPAPEAPFQVGDKVTATDKLLWHEYWDLIYLTACSQEGTAT